MMPEMNGLEFLREAKKLYPELIDKLIQLAIDEFNDNAKLHYDFVELGQEKVGKGLIKKDGSKTE